jgi:hypothetical protein
VYPVWPGEGHLAGRDDDQRARAGALVVLKLVVRLQQVRRRGLDRLVDS